MLIFMTKPKKCGYKNRRLMRKTAQAMKEKRILAALAESETKVRRNAEEQRAVATKYCQGIKSHVKGFPFVFGLFQKQLQKMGGQRYAVGDLWMGENSEIYVHARGKLIERYSPAGNQRKTTCQQCWKLERRGRENADSPSQTDLIEEVIKDCDMAPRSIAAVAMRTMVRNAGSSTGARYEEIMKAYTNIIMYYGGGKVINLLHDGLGCFPTPRTVRTTRAASYGSGLRGLDSSAIADDIVSSFYTIMEAARATVSEYDPGQLQDQQRPLRVAMALKFDESDTRFSLELDADGHLQGVAESSAFPHGAPPVETALDMTGEQLKAVVEACDRCCSGEAGMCMLHEAEVVAAIGRFERTPELAADTVISFMLAPVVHIRSNEGRTLPLFPPTHLISVPVKKKMNLRVFLEDLFDLIFFSLEKMNCFAEVNKNFMPVRLAIDAIGCDGSGSNNGMLKAMINEGDSAFSAPFSSTRRRVGHNGIEVPAPVYHFFDVYHVVKNMVNYVNSGRDKMKHAVDVELCRAELCKNLSRHGSVTYLENENNRTMLREWLKESKFSLGDAVGVFNGVLSAARSTSQATTEHSREAALRIIESEAWLAEFGSSSDTVEVTKILPVDRLALRPTLRLLSDSFLELLRRGAVWAEVADLGRLAVRVRSLLNYLTGVRGLLEPFLGRRQLTGRVDQAAAKSPAELVQQFCDSLAALKMRFPSSASPKGSLARSSAFEGQQLPPNAFRMAERIADCLRRLLALHGDEFCLDGLTTLDVEQLFGIVKSGTRKSKPTVLEFLRRVRVAGLISALQSSGAMPELRKSLSSSHAYSTEGTLADPSGEGAWFQRRAIAMLAGAHRQRLQGSGAAGSAGAAAVFSLGERVIVAEIAAHLQQQRKARAGASVAEGDPAGAICSAASADLPAEAAETSSCSCPACDIAPEGEANEANETVGDILDLPGVVDEATGHDRDSSGAVRSARAGEPTRRRVRLLSRPQMKSLQTVITSSSCAKKQQAAVTSFHKSSAERAKQVAENNERHAAFGTVFCGQAKCGAFGYTESEDALNRHLRSNTCNSLKNYAKMRNAEWEELGKWSTGGKKRPRKLFVLSERGEELLRDLKTELRSEEFMEKFQQSMNRIPAQEERRKRRRTKK